MKPLAHITLEPVTLPDGLRAVAVKLWRGPELLDGMEWRPWRSESFKRVQMLLSRTAGEYDLAITWPEEVALWPAAAKLVPLARRGIAPPPREKPTAALCAICAKPLSTAARLGWAALPLCAGHRGRLLRWMARHVILDERWPLSDDQARLLIDWYRRIVAGATSALLRCPSCEGRSYGRFRAMVMALQAGRTAPPHAPCALCRDYGVIADWGDV